MFKPPLDLNPTDEQITQLAKEMWDALHKLKTPRDAMTILVMCLFNVYQNTHVENTDSSLDDFAENVKAALMETDRVIH